MCLIRVQHTRAINTFNTSCRPDRLGSPKCCLPHGRVQRVSKRMGDTRSSWECVCDSCVVGCAEGSSVLSDTPALSTHALPRRPGAPRREPPWGEGEGGMRTKINTLCTPPASTHFSPFRTTTTTTHIIRPDEQLPIARATAIAVSLPLPLCPPLRSSPSSPSPSLRPFYLFCFVRFLIPPHHSLTYSVNSLFPSNIPAS